MPLSGRRTPCGSLVCRRARHRDLSTPLLARGTAPTPAPRPARGRKPRRTTRGLSAKSRAGLSSFPRRDGLAAPPPSEVSHVPGPAGSEGGPLAHPQLTLQRDVVKQPVTPAPGLKAPGLARGGGVALVVACVVKTLGPVSEDAERDLARARESAKVPAARHTPPQNNESCTASSSMGAGSGRVPSLKRAGHVTPSRRTSWASRRRSSFGA